MLAYLIQQVETGSKLTFDFLKSCCLKTNTEEKKTKLLNQKKQNQKKTDDGRTEETYGGFCMYTWTHLEFHRADLVEDFSHVLPDYGPGDFVVALSCGFHRVPCHVIESYHVGENAHCLVERTEPEEIDSKESGKKGANCRLGQETGERMIYKE